MHKAIESPSSKTIWFLPIHHTFTINCMFVHPTILAKRLRLASMGIEPTTFALLARRSNQLS